jgi:hypothetical protein
MAEWQSGSRRVAPSVITEPAIGGEAAAGLPLAVQQ